MNPFESGWGNTVEAKAWGQHKRKQLYQIGTVCLDNEFNIEIHYN